MTEAKDAGNEDETKQSIDDNKKPKFTKKIEIVDEEYVIENRYIHKRKSLTITSDGKLLCNPWNPETNKKGGIIRIECDGDIIIEKNGKISASARGWFGKYGFGQPQKLRHYDVFGGASYGSNGSNWYDNNTKTLLNGGETYGNNKIIKLYPGTGNKYLRGGGIIELIATNTISNNGNIINNGHGGCSGGTIFICCKRFINNGRITAKGGARTSFCGKGGDGRIAIYSDEYINNGTIIPKPYRHRFVDKEKNDDKIKSKGKGKGKGKAKKKKKSKGKGKNKGKKTEQKEDEQVMDIEQKSIDDIEDKLKEVKPKKSVYEYAMKEIVQKRESIKMNIIFEKKYSINLDDEKKMDTETIKKQRDITKAVNDIINMLLKYEEKITNPIKNIYNKLKISADLQKLLGTKMGFEIMEKHRKLYDKTVFREHMIIDRLVLELKFVKLLTSISFMEFSSMYRMSNNLFDLNAMATMRYTNGRMEPFNNILPRIRWRLFYEYLDKNGKIKKQNSDFKFREKSLESKTVLWDFGDSKIVQKYEILIKIDRSNDKYQSVMKNNLFAVQKMVNVARFYQIQSDDIQRCGFLRIENKAKLYPKEWYSSTKEGGIICIECYDLVNYGAIDVNFKGKYGKYGKGAGKLKQNKKKKIKKGNKNNENDNYYFGATYDGKLKLKTLVFGCGITGRKYLKGGGNIDLYIKDHFINYGVISSNGTHSSSAGSICICCKLFINYGIIQCIGGKEIVDKSGKGENGKIAIYTKVFENYGTISPETNVYIGDFEDGKQAFINRHTPSR